MLAHHRPLLAVLLCLATASGLNAEGPSRADLQPAHEFQKFLRVARKANSLEEILPFLPEETREDYRRSEQAFDKDTVRNLLGQSDMFRGSADLLSKTPYEQGLSRYRAIADKVRMYVSTEISHDHAVLHVKARVGDDLLPAKVRMVRERGEWKFEDLEVELGF